MKLFQILGNVTYCELTNKHANLAAALVCYPPSVLVVEAPDYVFEGWGYDGSKEGDDRFIQPTPPEGWLYDVGTGTFYPEEEIAPSSKPTQEQRLQTVEADIENITYAIEKGLSL